MKPKKKTKTSRAKRPAEKVPAARPRDKYFLRLFVAGATDRSRQAVLRIRKLCETTLKGRGKLEVIDIYQQPALAGANQIVATPTLIIQLPLPARRFIGNLANFTDLFSLIDLGGKSKIVL